MRLGLPGFQALVQNSSADKASARWWHTSSAFHADKPHRGCPDFKYCIFHFLNFVGKSQVHICRMKGTCSQTGSSAPKQRQSASPRAGTSTDPSLGTLLKADSSSHTDMSCPFLIFPIPSSDTTIRQQPKLVLAGMDAQRSLLVSPAGLQSQQAVRTACFHLKKKKNQNWVPAAFSINMLTAKIKTV